MSKSKYNNFYFFLLLFIFLFIGISNVYADPPDVHLPTAFLRDNDYELVCRYEDGVELTISRNDVFVVNTSLSITSANNDIDMYLTADQQNTLSTSDGGFIYNHDNLLTNKRCPDKLYVYDLPDKYNDEAETDRKDISTYYYSTKTGIEESIAGRHKTGFLGWGAGASNAVQKYNLTTKLVSEEIYVVSTKSPTICDYKVETENEFGTTSTASIYLFQGITFAEVGIHSASIDGTVLNTCPQGKIYINDPTAQPIANNGVSYQQYYRSVRFKYSSSAATCRSNNDDKECQEFTYIGTRGEDDYDGAKQPDLCDTLGNETIDWIRQIIKILQILVPVLVIILTAIDITKITLAGNIEDELPKKRKIIIIRFVVMVLFFFLPLISNLIIKLLYDAGIVKIGNIECLFK